MDIVGLSKVYNFLSLGLLMTKYTKQLGLESLFFVNRIIRKKSALRKFQEELRKDWCKRCQWENGDRTKHPCSRCIRNLNSDDSKEAWSMDAYVLHSDYQRKS